MVKKYVALIMNQRVVMAPKVMGTQNMRHAETGVRLEQIKIVRHHKKNLTFLFYT